MPKRILRLVALAVSLFLFAPSLFARVISYAPYSTEPSFPGIQDRTNRYFLMVEGDYFGWGGIILSPMPYNPYPTGKLVMYDSTGFEQPRVVYPKNDSDVAFSVVAVRERMHVPNLPITPAPEELSTILIQTDANHEGLNPTRGLITLLSDDGGETWKRVDLPANAEITQMPGNGFDVGGRFAKGRYSPVRIGTEEVPFMVYSRAAGAIYAIRRDGTTQQMLKVAPSNIWTSALLGSDRQGTVFLARSDATTLVTVSIANGVQPVGTFQTAPAMIEGWITPQNEIYLEMVDTSSNIKLRMITPQGEVLDLGPSETRSYGNSPRYYAIPTYDYTGAWIIDRQPTKPTILSRHSRATGMQVQWSDITAPYVEAIHAGRSGNTLMIQVHRDRPQADQRLFLDPALAIWRVGEPAPKVYDELFLNEEQSKGFVHLDVDAAANGAPFVFDSGAVMSGGGVIISPAPPSSGGGDVVQEWGVVRASLKQTLVLPGIGRTPGAYGSDWVSDLILQNPLGTAQNVRVTFTPSGADRSSSNVHVVDLLLSPMEIRLIRDVVKSAFGLDSANGSLLLVPDSGINATSRTYTRSSLGTYGYNMNAIDVYTAAGPRFPLSFAGAFLGSSFRTNLILTDTSGHGSWAFVRATGPSGPIGWEDARFRAPSSSQVQLNGLGTSLQLAPSETGGLLITPYNGSVIASVFAIDNRTNDPTYFPPDLPAPTVRTIPAVGHVDGANNSRFRSDVYLFNPSSQVRQVTLQVKDWATDEQPKTLQLTLLPREARVIRDFLFTAFNKTGFARLRYSSWGDAEGVRVTSRTYTTDENGGTYGFLMPPLNNFQAAASGDTLELLGTVHDAKFRTNVGLIELTGFANGQTATTRIEILDDRHRVVDSFSVNVPVAGGMQINDIFRARNIPVPDGTAMLIRISPTSGMFGAYASTVDNGTNDPSYIAANLGAKQ